MEHQIEHSKMEALRVLAETTMKISEAKVALLRIQELETEYIVKREEKAMKAIDRILDESTELMATANGNYTAVKELFETVNAFAESLVTAKTSFEIVLQDFHDRSAAWDESFATKSEELEDKKRAILVAKTQIENTKSSIEDRKREIEAQLTVLRDRESVADRNMKRAVQMELDAAATLELAKSKERENMLKANAILAKETQLSNREASLLAKETAHKTSELALADKYATLGKTLKEVMK